MKIVPVASFENEIHLYHIVIKGTDEEIGYQLGRLVKDKHHIDQSGNIDHESIKHQYEYLKERYPQHFARISGFARAYGKSVNDYDYDFSYFGKLPNGTACSAVYYPPALTDSGHGYISRNLDFSIPGDYRRKNLSFPFKHTYVVEMVPDSGYSSISLLCFEVFGLALEGINSEGLSVIHLADADTRIEHADLAALKTKKGFNEFLPIQYILDNCSTAGEAMDALKQMVHYHVAIPVHLLIADKQGKSFVFEYSADGAGKVFLENSPEAPTKITNFQLNRLTDPARAEQMETRSAENGLDRYRTLETHIDSIRFPVSERLIRQINSDVYVHTDHENERERTLFHCIYNTHRCSLKICLLPGVKQVKNDFHEFILNRRG